MTSDTSVSRQDGVVTVVTGLWAGISAVRIPGGARDISLFKKSRPTLVHPQTSIQRAQSFFSWGGRGVKMTTHLHPQPRLRTSGAIPLLPYTSSRRGEGRLEITAYTHVSLVSSLYSEDNDVKKLWLMTQTGKVPFAKCLFLHNSESYTLHDKLWVSAPSLGPCQVRIETPCVYI